MRPGQPHVERFTRSVAMPPEQAADFPADIAFLRTHCSVSLAALRRATATAQRDGVPAHACLIAGRGVSELLYYQALAAHLGLRFVQGSLTLAPSARPNEAIRHGYAPLADGTRWLLAPTGTGVLWMLARRALGRPMRDVLITTPTGFSALVRRTNGAVIADAASNALPRQTPRLSAKDIVSPRLGFALATALLVLFGCWIAAPSLVAALVGMLFFAVIAARLLLCAVGLMAPVPGPEPLTDAQLPFYSVLVPLKAEAGIVGDLVTNLDRIDYPRAKLEVKLIVEADDSATQFACFAARLAPHYEIVIAPKGKPQTKPRALNVALPLLKGDIVTIYDAEDAPAPDQLRKAAARFHHAPGLGCLQARLVINGDRLLSQLFAIEYAALFGLYNPGIAAANLPMALGGTSNHFRRSVLARVGGWDAWNVAEDADLGLRLARFGHRTEMLDSTTYESAPPDFGNWERQRRRWTKGWMQSTLVLGRDLRRLLTELGTGRTLALSVMLVALVGGPLASLPLTILVVGRLLACGMPHPHGWLEIIDASLWTWVFIAGPMSTIWAAYAGAKASRVKAPWHALFGMVPYQALIGVAAWGGLVDLCRDPYHWHKTHHGAVASARAARNKKRTGRSVRRPSAATRWTDQPLRALRAAYLASRWAFRATSSAMTRDARASAAAASAALVSSARRRSASRSASRAASRSARVASSISRSLARIASRSAMRMLRASTMARRAASRAFSSGLAMRA